MMQQVATTNADIAAFAGSASQSDQQDATFTKDFGKLLQQHQDARGSSDATNKVMNKTREQTASDKTEQQQTDLTDNDHKNVIGAGVASKEKSNATDRHSCDASCGAEEVDSDAVASSEAKLKKQLISDINELLRQFDLTKSSSQGADTGSDGFEASENARLTEHKVVLNEAQDWSSLVEKLHTLTGSENTSEITAESKQLLAEDVANLVQQTLGNEAISAEEFTANLLENRGGSSTVNAKIEANQSPTLPPLENVVAQILSEIDTSQLNSNSAEAEFQVNGLLDKLSALQAVFEASKSAATLGLGNKEKASHLAVDTSVATNNEALPQLVNEAGISALESTGEQLSNTLNQALIATVLSPASDVKENIQADSLRHSVAAPAQGENAEGSFSELVQIHSQEIPPTQVGTNSSSSNNTLDVLAILSGEKLDKALNNLLQRLGTEQATSEIQKAQQTNQQVAAVAATQLEQSALAYTNKDFIAALKAGVDEFKAQLAQGREPGIDLKGLIADTMSKSADAPGAIAKQTDQIELAVKGFSQVLDFAQQLNSVLEQQQGNTLSHNNYMREVGQGQLDQLKQFQAQSSQFDKAVNISKPEGLQQLAEKVRWMVNAKQLVAEIRLDPAELGSMQVKVSVTGESANISFVVQSQQARDAMENATPRLREMLAEKGIELGQSSVKQDQGQAADAGKEQLAGHKNSSAENGIDEIDENPNEAFIQQPIVNGALGGIDYFV